MQEGGIADYGHPVLDVLPALCLFHSMQAGNAGSHADGRIHGAKRWNCPEGIASDVSRRVHVQLLEHVIDASVRTARAEDRRPLPGIMRRLSRSSSLFSQNGPADHVRAVFALDR